MPNIGIEYPEARQMRFYDLADPGPLEPDQILIRTRYSAITNGTERHALMGQFGWKKFPSRHGYQHVGVIEEVGDSVQDFKPGEPVFYGQYVGHRGWHVVEIDAHGRHLVLPLPGNVDHRCCALFGVAGVASRGVQRFGITAAQKVWVAGLGPIGQFAAQAARAVGAHVTVTDVNEHRLSVAEQLGAHRTLNAADAHCTEALQAGGPYNCIIDACGIESLLLDIHQARLLAHGGVIGCLAVRGNAVFPWSMLHGLEAAIEVSCHFTLDVLGIVLHFVQQGIIRIEPLVTHNVPINQAPDIYHTLRDRPADLLGVIFDWAD